MTVLSNEFEYSHSTTSENMVLIEERRPDADRRQSHGEFLPFVKLSLSVLVHSKTGHIVRYDELGLDIFVEAKA